MTDHPRTIPETKYLLRTVDKNRQSYGGFQWPHELGTRVEPSNGWSDTAECGNGIHGLLNGEGEGSLLDWSDDAIWQIVSTDADVVELDGKVKAPWVILIAQGDRYTVTQKLAELCPSARAIVGITVTAGHRGQATAGYRGQATAGYGGKATAGDEGQATAGYRGKATAGYRGKATAGHRGQATAGHRGQATAGYRGKATAGYRGQAAAGDGGQAAAGERGTLAIEWHDGIRMRLSVGYVGENGIRPNTTYRCDDKGEFVAVSRWEVLK